MEVIGGTTESQSGFGLVLLVPPHLPAPDILLSMDSARERERKA